MNNYKETHVVEGVEYADWFDLCDSPDFSEISTRITDHGRWTITKEIVVQSKSTHKYYLIRCREAATEHQVHHEEWFLQEVKPIKVESISYVPV